MGDSDRKVPILLWPIYAVWWLLTLVLGIVGRVLCALIGLGVMAAGIAVTLTILGAPVGIPVVVFGFLLVVRALF